MDEPCTIAALVAVISEQQQRFRSLGYAKAIIKVEVSLGGYSAMCLSLEFGPYDPTRSAMVASDSLGDLIAKIRDAISEMPWKWTAEDVDATLGVVNEEGA